MQAAEIRNVLLHPIPLWNRSEENRVRASQATPRSRQCGSSVVTHASHPMNGRADFPSRRSGADASDTDQTEYKVAQCMDVFRSLMPNLKLGLRRVYEDQSDSHEETIKRLKLSNEHYAKENEQLQRKEIQNCELNRQLREKAEKLVEVKERLQSRAMAAEDAANHAIREHENVKNELEKAKEDKRKAENNLAKLQEKMKNAESLMKQIQFH